MQNSKGKRQCQGDIQASASYQQYKLGFRRAEVKPEGREKCYMSLSTNVTTGRPEDETGMFLKCWSERGPGIPKNPTLAVFQHSPASGPQKHPFTPTMLGSSATGQKLLQVKHESRGGGAEKKLGVCWRENSRGHELPAVMFSAALMEPTPGAKSAKNSSQTRSQDWFQVLFAHLFWTTA